MGTKTYSDLAEFTDAVEKDPALQAKLQSDPVGTLQQSTSPLATDKWIYRGALIILGVVIITVTIAGILFYSSTGTDAKEIPEGILALATTALGALAGLMSPVRSGG